MRSLVLIEIATPYGASRVAGRAPRTIWNRLLISPYLEVYRAHREIDPVLLRQWQMIRTIERLVEGPDREQSALRRAIRQSGGPRNFA